MSNTRFEDLPTQPPPFSQSTSEPFRNSNVMQGVVKNTLDKLYEGKNEPNPLVPHQYSILKYFKQYNIDLDTFHRINKEKFIISLKHYIFGSLQPPKKAEEAIGLLFAHIDFLYNLPRTTPTPTSVTSPDSQTMFKYPSSETRSNRVSFKGINAQRHSHTQTHSLPSQKLDAFYTIATIKLGIVEALRPKSIKINDSNYTEITYKCGECHSNTVQGSDGVCEDCQSISKESRLRPMMIKHKTANAMHDDDDIDDYKALHAPSGIRVDIASCYERKLEFDPNISKTPRARRGQSELKTHGVYHDVQLYLKKKRNYENIVVKMEDFPHEMIECNHDQFLYIASTVIHDMNDEIKRSNDDEDAKLLCNKLLYNKSLILGYFHYCERLEGLSFKRSLDSFVHNIKHIVFHSEIKNDFLTERLKEKYANELYEKIDTFKLNEMMIYIDEEAIISFHPSSEWLSKYNDDKIRSSSFDILSTLNQYQQTPYLMKSKENRKVVDALNECNDKISNILNNKWVIHIKNKDQKEQQIWSHTIQSVRECTQLNMLYLLDCILKDKLDKKAHNKFLLFKQSSEKILHFFEKNQIDGDLFVSRQKDPDFIRALNNSIDAMHDLREDLGGFFRYISGINMFKITTFHIQTDMKWNESIQSIKECKEKDILYIVIHLLSNPSLKALLPSKHQIVEYFVRNEINGRKFTTMKEQIFVDRLDKFIKFEHKAPFIKLYYAIKRFRIQDMANIAVEQQTQSSAHLNQGGFIRWERRTNFKNISRVGYDCDDGVITAADIISHSKEGNKSKIQIAVKNIGCESHSYLAEPFWINLPSNKLCEPMKETIEQSHYDVFNKWIMILRIKSRTHSIFEDNVFRDMILLTQIHPQLTFTIRNSNYSVKLEDKTYDNVLQSFFAYSLTTKCVHTRCYSSPKLNCYCDSSGYQTCTYYMMMAILRESRHQNNKMLNMLKSQSQNTIQAAGKMCEYLRDRYRGHYVPYIDRYKKHLQEWLLNDFYNIICSHCGSINKSIMINRVFHYSSTIRNCRTCGVICVGGSTQYEDVYLDNISHRKSKSKGRKSKSISNFCCGSRKKIFIEERIDYHKLETALNKCRFDEEISQHKENDLLNFLLSLLNERFDELAYYLSRFLDDVDDWKALRIKITADYYFYRCKEAYVPVQIFMHDAGIHPRHTNIFKDCWNRALFQSVKENQPLIHILHNIDRQDEEKHKSNAKKDVICIALNRLQMFRKLTPSISIFTTQFIQTLKKYALDQNVDLFTLIQLFLDFKIDRNVFGVIHELELLSLIFNKWEYLTTLPSISYWSHYFGVVIEPKRESLIDELKHELKKTGFNIDVLYEDLYHKAREIWKKKRKKILAKRSKWNQIIGVQPGTPIGVKYILAVLLFAEIPELRYKIRALLAETPINEVHQRFGQILKLLKEVIYLYGTQIPCNKLESMYYSMDETIVLDKHRAMLNIPILGSDRPSAYKKNDNKFIAECVSNDVFECFNVSTLLDSTPEQNFFIFFGGEYDVKPDIHIDRQQLRLGTNCKIYSQSRHKFLKGEVTQIYHDDRGEWIRVSYFGSFKDVKRMTSRLLLIKHDEWNDIVAHFGGEIEFYHDRQEPNHPFLNTLMEAGYSILKEHEIQCTPELIFRIKTVLIYYKTSQNIIPDCDTFIKETNIHVPDHKIDEFREIYQKHKENVQRKRLQTARPSVQLKKRRSLMDMLPILNLNAAKDLELYDLGIFMRYDVNNPRFESLAEETMFNEVVNITNERFNEHLMKAKEIHSQHCFMMLSKADDLHFGIERYQPISIAHIIAVIIHTEEPKYSRDFTRSCLLLNRIDSDIVIQNHCNNFYWFGRYLFECIEYFGETMDEQSSMQQKHVQGLPQTFKFDLFTPLINFPRSTTKSLDMAYHYAADTGCVLQLIPKYYGVLNSTKFINLFAISEDYDDDTRLFFGRRCAIQIHNIWLSDHCSLQYFIFSLLYFEKIMLQTIFDRQFFNTKHLYDKDGSSSNIQMVLFNLIRSCTAMMLYQQQNAHRITKLDKETQFMIITQYFPDIALERHIEIRYAVNLLKHWCLKRTFITFESFAAEIPFMIRPLRHYFVTRNDKNEPYHIHIDRLQTIMPNLKNYRDFNKQVVAVEPLQHEQHVVKVDSKSIIDTIDSNLADYYRAQDIFTYNNRFKTWCDKQKHDVSYVKTQLKSFDDCGKDILAFDKQFPFMDRISNIDRDAYVFDVLKKATKPNLLHLLYQHYTPDTELDEKQNDDLHVTRKGSLRLSRTKSMFGPINEHQYEESDAIYRVVSNCQRHEIPDQICSILQKLGFWRKKSSKKMSKYDIQQQNKEIKKLRSIWKDRNKHKLEEFYVPISKLHKATRKDFIKVAEKIKLFDEHMMESLCNKLMERLFTDIERMKQWKCTDCWFMNRKMMIGGLWCLYNQLNECGLCGSVRYNFRTGKSNSNRSKKSAKQNRSKSLQVPTYTETLQLPQELKAKWRSIKDTQHAKCSYKNTTATANVTYLEEFSVDHMTQYIAHLLRSDSDLKTFKKLKVHKNTITHYFDEHAMNGIKFLAFKRKDIVHNIVNTLGGNKTLTKSVTKLHARLTAHVKEITIECKPMKRIAVVLAYYHSLTEPLKSTTVRYSCSIRQFLSSFDSENSRVQLLDDFEHILQHNASIRTRQPYITPCNEGNMCIHQMRIQSCEDMNLSLQEKQELFNCDDWKDFEYILLLDKIHCALFHNYNNEQSFLCNKEKDIIRRYSKFAVYSTGIYIDHSSLSPLHVNLKEELLNNRVYNVEEKQWQNALKESKDILEKKRNSKQHDKKWRAQETNEVYGIRAGDRIQIEHILVIFLYTSNSELCRLFRLSYRSSEYDDNNQHIRTYHINNFYWMGRFIYTAIQFFGQKPKRKDTFYHGLRKKFLFTEFSTIFEPPTSTTIDKHIAQSNFSGDDGIVLRLGPKFKNELNNSKYLDVSAISNYHKEQERLFAGMTVLAVVDIQYKSGGKVHNVGQYAKAILYFERIVEQTIHNKSYYNYDIISPKDQQNYLFPLIQHQMQRNGFMDANNDKEEKIDGKKEYLYALFEHFCDSKQEYINLTCINDEIKQMHESIRNILFFQEYKGNMKCEINDANVQLIFPKLKGYKNHLGYWIHFEM